MHALIDADRIAYAFGGFTNDDGYPLEWPLVAERIDSNIESILQATRATSYTLYLTPDDGSNFRINVATIRPYKGHRSASKPFWYEQIRRYLIDKYRAILELGIEADDAIGIKASESFLPDLDDSISRDIQWTVNGKDANYVICSVDKDLDMIPGYHYNELKPDKGVYWVSETDGLRAFYVQLVTGDPTDNIPGLYGVGSKSAVVRNIAKSSSELDMYTLARSEYEKRFGSYWVNFLFENAMLLWIKRKETSPAHGEIVSRLDDLEKQRLNLEADLRIESVSN